ncbi:MAG: CRTAC1 family protein [Saprospiraceae bacterium]
MNYLSKKGRLILFWVTISIYSCSIKEDCNNCTFKNISHKTTGLDFTNFVDHDTNFNIIKYLYFYNGGGVATGDINNDGLEDVMFTSNQGQDELYLNLGHLKFKKITTIANLDHTKGWSTGVNIIDINGDGWKDIFICRLGTYRKKDIDHNLVYINNCDGTFSEKSKELGLNFSGYSTQCAFFDMDRDGDLDAYLLNHSVKNASQFQPSHIRNIKDTLAGDILYENINGVFYDISKDANIYQSSIGYGLGISISDFNNDGWQDIYIGNDFHENDYLYLNLKNKTFKEICSTSFGHTSNFSMGNDCDDIDNDGNIDIFTVDMKPFDEKTYKNSGGWENLQIYNFKRSYGYHHQQPKNSFQWNRGLDENGYPIFSEIASFLNLDASDWSWSPLIFDFDHDGNKDIFISNGIKSRPNDLDYINFLSNILHKQNKDDLTLIKSMPEGMQKNLFFRNTGNLHFEQYALKNEKPSLSNGASMCDLDNDGDYDIITNNYNEISSLYENRTNNKKATSIELKNNTLNTEAIGARIIAFYKNRHYVYQVKSVQGFQSSSTKKIILPNLESNCDSIKIIWPEGEIQLVSKIKQGSHQIIEKLHPFEKSKFEKPKIDYIVKPISSHWYRHEENDYNDQLNEPWIPYLLSSVGPHIACSSDNICFVTNSKNKMVFFTLNKGAKIQVINKGLESRC